MTRRLIAIDVGAGTADIVIRRDDERAENSVKLVVPSRTQVVAARIRAATGERAAVVFRGPTMGGGADTRAMKVHTAAGLPFLATASAARSFADDLERVRGRGVEIVSEREAAELVTRGWLSTGGGRRRVTEIRSGDVDVPALGAALSALGVPGDFDGAAIAVQDHGYTPDGSNRAYRFSVWERAVRERHALRDLFYRGDRDEVPERLTRMRAAVDCLRDLIPGAGDHPAAAQAGTATAASVVFPLLAGDTGPAALLGALTDPPAAPPDRKPRLTVLVNVGNGHTIAAVERDGRLAGVYEHHTRALDGRKLERHLRRFLEARLTSDEVRDDGGHGAVIDAAVPDDVPLMVTGPNRALLDEAGFDIRHPAPWGDMMIAGAVGLLEAFRTDAG